MQIAADKDCQQKKWAVARHSLFPPDKDAHEKLAEAERALLADAT